MSTLDMNEEFRLETIDVLQIHCIQTIYKRERKCIVLGKGRTCITIHRPSMESHELEIHVRSGSLTSALA